MNRLARVYAIAALMPTLISVANATGCAVTDFENSENAPIVAKKVEYALAAISDSAYQKTDPSCVAANIRYVGLAHVQRAVPALIALLGYKVPPRSSGKPLNSDVYPAISALSNIGGPAVGALIEVLASKDNDSIESKNAIDALMDMRVYRDDLNQPLRSLKQAAAKETDPTRAARLSRAIQDARNKWCRYAPCTE